MKLRPLVYAIAYRALDFVVVRYTPNPVVASWNWAGKLASIALAIAAMLALRLTRDEVGLVVPRRSIAIGVAVAVAFHASTNLMFADGEPTTLETILYQATMPGLAEELAYRGVAFALFTRGFGSARVAAIVTTLAFGLGHGFAVLPFLFAAVLGGWFAWLRVRTGSVVGCVIAHNAANVVGTLAATL